MTSKRKAFSILHLYFARVREEREYGDQPVEHVADVVHLRPQLLDDLPERVVQRVIVYACEVIGHIQLELGVRQLVLD